jgi:hypothetical protein
VSDVLAEYARLRQASPFDIDATYGDIVNLHRALGYLKGKAATS